MKLASFLNPENVIVSTILASLAWLLLSHTDLRQEVGKLQVMQVENKRVAEIVYVLNDTLIEIKTNQVYIKEQLDAMKENGKTL